MWAGVGLSVHMDSWWEKNVPLIHNISLQKIAIAYGSSWQSLLHAFGCPAE